MQIQTSVSAKADASPDELLARLRRAQDVWQARYRAAGQRVDELSGRSFVGGGQQHGVRVLVDHAGRVAEVRVDPRRLSTVTTGELAAEVVAAERAARRERRVASGEITQQALGIDPRGLERLVGRKDTGRVSAPAATGDSTVDGMLKQLHELRERTGALAANLTRGTVTGASKDGLVTAVRTGGRTSRLEIKTELVHKGHRQLEISITEAIQRAGATADRTQREQLAGIEVFGIPLGQLLSGQLGPDELLDRLLPNRPIPEQPAMGEQNNKDDGNGEK